MVALSECHWVGLSEQRMESLWAVLMADMMVHL
jgi:hypothetical protein